MVVSATCGVYEEACSEVRRWIEEATEITFPCNDFRESLKDGMLLCKLVEKLSGINIGQLNLIPRSLAWMDNLVIFLNVCRYMGLKKFQLFGVDDLVAVRNQAIPVKVKQKEDDRRLRNVLITIFWLGRLAYSLEDYRGPLPQLDAFETLINKNRPPEMVDQQRNKFELDTLSGSGTWPKINRSSRSRDSNVKEGSLEYFEHMRRQLIPRLTANVKEKAVMYDTIQQEANHDHIHVDERRRSYNNLRSEDDNLTGKTAKRAHSFGVLNTTRNHKPNNENKAPSLYTGSITRRTPLRVNQSHIQKEPAKPYSHDPLKMNRVERSFQYDTKPIKVKIPSSHSPVSTRTKNKVDTNSDYVSVKAMIKQWSVPDAKSEIPSQPIHEKYRNRRSLPANFKKVGVLSERKELPQSKSVTEDMHYKRQNNYKKIATSNRSMDTRLSSEVNRGLPDTKQSYFVENRTNTRRKSEPSNYSRKEYDSLSTDQRNRSSSMRNREDSKDRYSKEKARESVVKEAKTTADTYAAIPYPQQQFQKEKEKDTKSREHIHVSSRRSLPFPQKTEVKHLENYMDQKLYQPKSGSAVDRRKLESIGKYATMPARRVRMSHDELIVGKNERNSDVQWGKMRIKADEIYGKASGNEYSQRRSSSQRSPSSHRRLPTYEEAIVPLQKTDTVDAAETSQTDNKKISENDYLSVVPAQLVSNKATTVAKRAVDYSSRKQTVNENVSKQHVTHIHAAENVYPVLTSKGAPRKDQMIPKRRHSKEGIKDAPSMKQTVVFTNKSTGTLVRKSSGERTPHKDESSYINDVNNNKLPAYDGEALQIMLASQQRSSRSNSNKKSNEIDTTSQENELFVRKDMKPKEESKVVLNEYERLREEQKIILDEDFKYRGRTGMDPNVAQQFTSQGGVNFSNVVHEGEILELVAAEEKYWKHKVERKEKSGKEKEMKKNGNINEKQERVNKMLQELKIQEHGQKEKIDYSEITDTLRAEEEFLAQEAEKLLKQRFEEKSSVEPTLRTEDTKFDIKQQTNDITKHKSSVEGTSALSTVNPGLHSILKTTSTRQKKPPSITSSEDINLKPEADQAYQHHHPRRILRTRSPVYICSGCRLPVERDICLFVAELQSYWHEKCFCCSVCHSNLIEDDQTPKIRVMFSRIHCEKCLSNKKTGGQSTMV